MMDTILNCGLGPHLAGEFGEQPWFWQRCLDFARMFARTVDGLELLEAAQLKSQGREGEAPAEPGPAKDSNLIPFLHETGSAGASPSRSKILAAQIPESQPEAEADNGRSRDLLYRFYQEYAHKTGKEFPQDPWDAARRLHQCRVRLLGQRTGGHLSQPARSARPARARPSTSRRCGPAKFPAFASRRIRPTSNGNRLVIEASYGLGESVVSGDVDPDRFVIHRDNAEQD